MDIDTFFSIYKNYYNENEVYKVVSKIGNKYVSIQNPKFEYIKNTLIRFDKDETIEFNPVANCSLNGLYFSSKEDIQIWYDMYYMNMIQVNYDYKRNPELFYTDFGIEYDKDNQIELYMVICELPNNAKVSKMGIHDKYVYKLKKWKSDYLYIKDIITYEDFMMYIKNKNNINRQNEINEEIIWRQNKVIPNKK